MSRIVDDVIHVLRQNGVEHPLRESLPDLIDAIFHNWSSIQHKLSLRDTGHSYVTVALAELICAEQREEEQCDRLREAWRERRAIVSEIRAVADKHEPL